MNSTITIADAQGNILRTVTCPTNLAALQVGATEISTSGEYISVTHYIDPITRTAAAKPAKPSAYHTWDGATRTWTLPATTLALAQADQLTKVSATYQADIQRDVAYMGTTFQADSASQDTLTKTLSALGGATPPGFFWVDALNNQVPMSFAQLQGLAGAMMAQGWAAFQAYQGKKAAIRAATTVAAVQAIS